MEKIRLTPCAKINLGLNVVEKREDGYHNIETIFFAIPLTDTLEVENVSTNLSCSPKASLSILGNKIKGDPQDNLVMRAFNLLAKDYKMKDAEIKLTKNIPSEAGLGGGSSDAASMLIALNELNNLGLTITQLQQYASQLGADCAFFINPIPQYASGIGNIFAPVNISYKMSNKWILLVKPSITISTKDAYREIVPCHPQLSCREAIKEDFCKWKKLLSNDFEKSIFRNYPELSKIKQILYQNGAELAMMSGSGSTMFGIFNNKPSENILSSCGDCLTYMIKL